VCSARLYRVKICETDSNHVEYMGEETNEWRGHRSRVTKI
jgi:hypothetical protein